MAGPFHPRIAEEWEEMWAPYTESTYQMVLDQIRPTDIVLEIGAGDLRLARRLAEVAKKVYAIEKNRQVLSRAAHPLPANLEVMQGDARFLEFPHGVTCGVLLMRHCLHFHLYMQKLNDCGATRLISNARWRYEPEVIDLQMQRTPFEQLNLGWYACWCGATGFKEGPTTMINTTILEVVHEVQHCPQCTT